MVESVISYMMPTFHYHLVYVRMLAYVITYYKEGGFDSILIQYIKNPRCNFRDRAVIKGKIYRMLFRIFPEDAFRVYLA